MDFKEGEKMISEYVAPDDFEIVSGFDKRVLMDATRKYGWKTEKLFTNRQTFNTIELSLL